MAKMFVHAHSMPMKSEASEEMESDIGIKKSLFSSEQKHYNNITFLQWPKPKKLTMYYFVMFSGSKQRRGLCRHVCSVFCWYKCGWRGCFRVCKQVCSWLC